MTLLLCCAVILLAYSNGANDNFKGVATLWGSGVASYRVALAWATLSTFAGSLSAIALAQTLLKHFSGKGLVPDALVVAPSFLTAVALGAGLTVMLATRLGFPISTTHGLIGGIVGGGLVAAGGQVAFGHLGRQFLLPLLLSPVLAIVFGGAFYAVLHRCRVRLGIGPDTCVCVGGETGMVPTPATASAQALQNASLLSLSVDSEAQCAARYTGAVRGIEFQRLIDAAHFLSAGVVGFARGLNDTPKLTALLLAASLFDVRIGFTVIALAMALGGVLAARKLAETLSHRITGMNPGQGCSANLATGLLVILASVYGLPVSTTHVSVGAMFGVGLSTGRAHPHTMSAIVLSWLLTLPCAAAISASAYWCMKGF
jgi:PiT family inorganic phosphate transporter